MKAWRPSTHGRYTIEAFSTKIVLFMKGLCSMRQYLSCLALYWATGAWMQQLINFLVTNDKFYKATILVMTTGSFRTTVFYPNWSRIRLTNSVPTCDLNIIHHHASKKWGRKLLTSNTFPFKPNSTRQNDKTHATLKLGSLINFKNIFPESQGGFQRFSPKVLNGSRPSSSHWATIRYHWTHLSLSRPGRLKIST